MPDEVYICGVHGGQYEAQFFMGLTRDYGYVCWDCWQSLEKCGRCGDIVDASKLYVEPTMFGGEILICDQCKAKTR